MAKQTFTVGQILTSAQMTNLQQTAMGGGSATAKTASYVLIAADAGSTVAMNAAGSTTITVNTALFAAGDTVFIQNLGAGVCTVTAGTATVSTAGSLVLAQNQGGELYFTSASASIFFQYATPQSSGDIEGVTAGTGISGGGTSGTVTVTNSMATAIDAKGDLVVGTGADAFSRLAVGTNTHVLTADSAEATGLKWAAPSGGGSGMTFLHRSSFTGVSTVNYDYFSSSYYNYLVIVEQIFSSDSTPLAASLLRLRHSGTTITAGNYNGGSFRLDRGGSTGNTASSSATSFTIALDVGSSSQMNSYSFNVEKVGNASEEAAFHGTGTLGDGSYGAVFFGGSIHNAQTYTGFQLLADGSNITGTVSIYGLAKS